MSDQNIFVPIGDQRDGTDQWSDYTVLYSCVSVGNVPQLAIDLLISTLIECNDCRLCGYLYSTALMPLSGPDPYRFGGHSLATSAQVFECVDRKLLLVQQRTPLYRELRKEFYESFSKWLSGYRLKRVVILTSSFIQHLASALTSGDLYPIQYLRNKHYSEDKALVEESINWSPVERVDAFSLERSEAGVIHLPGSGCAKALLKYLDKYNISGISLVLYCSEGDNRPHSSAFVNSLNLWLNLIDFNKTDVKIKSWVNPFSWRLLFGDEPPKTIY